MPFMLQVNDAALCTVIGKRSCPNSNALVFKQSIDCAACPNNCANCSATDGTCQACVALAGLYNGTCRSPCPIGFYLNQSVGICAGT